MGTRNGPYNADFPEGTTVRIASLVELAEFRASWKYHHPLADEQLEFSGRIAKVASVGYYHGGYELYELEGIPGLWHECCLAPSV
jgi:hypothetical protein